MTTRHALGRHRATPVRTNPLESISKAVSSNAGSVGRQAAVIAAASGLVLSIGVPAQATPATREADKAPVADVLQADLVAKKASVQAPATVKVAAAKKKDAPAVNVPSIKSATDGSVYRADQAAQRKAVAERVAERQEAAQEAAADRAEAQEAAADRAGVQEAAAERRQAASNRQASTESTSSNSSSSSNSNDGSDGAAMTRESRSGSTSNTTTTASAPKKEKKTETVASTGNSSIAAMAAGYKGAPYVWGGSTPGGWDCSGFVQYIYGKAGISLPHNTSAIRNSGKFAKTSSPKPGDLVYQNGGSHVGIYIGGGKIVGAQNPSVGTVERPADSPYGPLMGYYTYVG